MGWLALAVSLELVEWRTKLVLVKEHIELELVEHIELGQLVAGQLFVRQLFELVVVQLSFEKLIYPF